MIALKPAELAPLQRKSIVALPDLYVDAITALPPWRQTAPKLAAIARRGGGTLPIGPVDLKVGGNAANLALAMARLGARVDLIAETDHVGFDLLQRAAHGTQLGLDHVRVGAEASVTLGLECARANVMLSHAGPVKAFGPARLRPADWRLIQDADAVAMVNWSQNAKGTALLETVARRMARRDGFLLVDTGDVSHRRAEERRGLTKASAWRRVGALSVNEHELRALVGGDAPLIPTAQRLSRRLGTRIDLHTRLMGASVEQGSVHTAPATRSPPRRITGAGDAWNAGNLAGELLGLPATRRLQLAHRIASLHVTGRNGVHVKVPNLANLTKAQKVSSQRGLRQDRS